MVCVDQVFIHPNLTLLSDYEDSLKKVLVKDEDDIEYFLTPNSLSKGCPISILVAVDKTKCYINKARKIHGDKYDYSKLVYLEKKPKVEIICPIHGLFLQAPQIHLIGQGCPECGKILAANSHYETTEYFIEKARLIHGDKYDYSLVDYKRNDQKIKVICPIHGVTEQTPTSHFNTHGCNSCAMDILSKAIQGRPNYWSHSVYKNLINTNQKPTPTLYLIRCFNEKENFLKIGITINSVKMRFKTKLLMPYNYIEEHVLKTDIDTVLNLEVLVKRQFKSNKYKPQISFGGEHECFDDIIKDEIIEFINQQINA